MIAKPGASAGWSFGDDPAAGSCCAERAAARRRGSAGCLGGRVGARGDAREPARTVDGAASCTDGPGRGAEGSSREELALRDAAEAGGQVAALAPLVDEEDLSSCRACPC